MRRWRSFKSCSLCIHGKACHTILRSLCSLKNRVPLPPHSGDRINRSMLSCRDMAPLLSTHSPTTKWGEGGGASHQRGMHFQRPQGGCMVFAAKGGIKNGAEGAVPRQRSDTIYLPRAEPSTRPGGVSRSRTEPLAPRAKGPAAPSTLTPVRACQPSGILESTAPVPILTAPQQPHSHYPTSTLSHYFRGPYAQTICYF